MTDIATANGKQSTGSQLSEQEYKELCKKLRHEQMARSKKKRLLPVLKSPGNVKDDNIKCKVSESPVDWEQLPTCSFFTLDTNKSQLLVKSGTTRAINLSTGKSTSVGGGAVFRIYV